MKKEWKKELARDVLALGSWVFFALVVVRALIKPYRPFVDQLVIAALVLIVVGFIYRDWDGYLARGLVLVVFTSLFYEDNLFTGFSILAGVFMIVSSRFVGNSWRKIGVGLGVGVVGVLVGWYLGGFSLGLF